MALDLTYDPDWKPARPQGAADPAEVLDLTYDPAWTPSNRNTGLASDLATDLKRGAQKLPGALTGLADIPVAALTGERYVSRAADALGDATGFQPGKWADAAADEYSPQRKAGAAAIERAWQNGSAGDIAGAYLRNPGNVAGLVAESIPSMLAGGLVGRAALAGAARLAPTAAAAPIAPVVAGAAGEGAMIAGQTMESISDDVDPRRAAAAAAAAGLAGSALGVAGGALARRLGVIDPETALAGGVAATGRAPMGLTRRLAGGATFEGLLQEMPQSVTEQALQNWAEEKPLGEGVARAAVEGTMAGGLIGAGANVMPVGGGPASPAPTVDPNAGPLSRAASLAQANQAAMNQQQRIADEETGAGTVAGDPRAAWSMGQARRAEEQAATVAAERIRASEQAAQQDAAETEIAGATGLEAQTENLDFNRFVGEQAEELETLRARAADTASLERAGVREEMRTARDQLTAEGAFEAEQRARDRQRYDAAAIPFERILPEDFDTLNPIRAGQGEVLDPERPPARGLPPPEQQGALPAPEGRSAGSLEHRPQPPEPLRATEHGQVGTSQQFEELDATRAVRREQMRVARERARFVSADAEARAARTVPYTEQTAQREAERMSNARQEAFTVVPHPGRSDRFAVVPTRVVTPADQVAPSEAQASAQPAPQAGVVRGELGQAIGGQSDAAPSANQVPIKNEPAAVAGVQPAVPAFDQAAVAAPESGAATGHRARAADPVVIERIERDADDLRAMSQDAGWAEQGGRLLRDADGKVSRTKWIARADWFMAGMEARPDVLAQHIEDTLAGRSVPAKSRRTLEGMLEWLDAQRGQATLDEDASMYDFEASFDNALDTQDVRDVADFFDDSFEPADFAEISEIDAMRALGFTEEEIADAAGQAQAGAGSTETADARGTAEAGSRTAEAGRTEEEAGREGSDEGLTLDSYTNEEIAQQELAQRERTEAEARAEREASERHRQERERAEVRARSEAAGQTFELGMDPMENLTGQGGLFAAPAAEDGNGATGDQGAPQPEAFVSTPDGSIDFGEQKKGMKLLWGGSEPAPAAAGQQPPYAGAPAEESGQGAPIARGQSSDATVAQQPDAAGASAAEPGGRYTAQERGNRARKNDGYTQDLFGAPVSEARRVPDTPRVQPGIAGAEALRAAGEIEGAKYAVEAGPSVTGFLKSAFERVESAPQAAHTLAGLRKYAQERFQVLVLDSNDRPISVLNLFSGATTQTSVYPEVVTKAVYETPGAAKIWYAHNHPSTNPMASPADERLTRELSSAFGRGTGIEVAGHVVIAGRKASELDANGDPVGPPFDIPAGARTQSVRITERRFRKVGTLTPGELIDSPTAARKLVGQITEGTAGVVFLNAHHAPVGFLPMTAKQMQTLRDGKGARLLFGGAARSNASAAILYFPDSLKRTEVLSAATNLYEALSPRDVRLLDALHGTDSLAERGELTGNGKGFMSLAGREASTPEPDGLTREGVREAIASRFPSLARPLDAMLKRGDEARRGGVVVVERARDLAGTFASKTGRTMEEALDLLQMSQGAQAAPASLAEVEALWDARGIDNAISEKNGIITLHKIIVQAGQRESGVGTQAMRELIAYADRTGQQIALTPSSDFGGNKRRLEGFYRRLGFRTYKGFAVREKRIRDPEVLQSQNGDIQGFFDPRSGITFLVAPNLTADTAPAVLLHEAVHGKQREEIDRKALQMIENRGTRAKPLREFLLRVAQRMEDAGESGNSAEAASYIVEQAVTEGRQAGFSAIDGKLLNWIDATIGKPVGDLVRGFVAMVRAWALRKGLNFEPSVDDLVAIARSNLQQMARGDATGGERVQASRLARSPSTITAAWESPEPSKLDSLIYTLQNKQVDMKRVVDAVKEQVGEIEDQWNPYLQEELFHGRSAKGVRDFLAHEMRPLLAEMRRSGVEMAELEKFLHARHAPEANAHIAKINPNEPDLQDGGSGMTNKEAADHLASIAPDRRRTLDALAKQIDTINASTRKLMVDSGLETAETIKAWEAAYKNYVPLQREDVEAGGLGIGQGFSVRGPASKRRTGSKKAVIDILANIALQREKTIVRAEKNRVAQANYALAIKAPNPDFWMPVNPDEAKAFTPAQQAKMASELVSMGLDPADAQNFVKEPVQRYVDPRTGLVAERINPVLRGADNVLALRIEGKDRFVFFNRKDDRAQRMVHALKNLDADQLGHVFGVLAKLTRFFAAVNTQWNPIFGVVNLTRDTQAALLQLSTTPIRGSEKAVLKNVLPAMRGIYAALRAEREGRALPNSPWAKAFDEFRNEGGQTGYRDMFSNSQERADALAKELNPEGWMDSPLGKVFTANGVLRVPMARAQQMAGGLFNWLTDYNDTLENAVRLSAYMEAKAKGLSSQEAASVAKNLTVNFNRKGQIATQAGALYAFFNAAMQGTTRMLQTLKGPAGRKIILGGLTLGALQAVTLAAAGFDDEEPPEFVRERSIVIPLGDGKYASIPMPLGFHVIPSTSRILTEWALSGFRDTTKRFGDFVALFADTFNPIGNAGWSMQTLAPTALDPVAALAENRDWTGKPIAQQDFNSLRPTPGHARARDTASELSKALAYWVNLATGGTDYKPGLISPTPDQIDYLIGQITGGVGREYLKAEQTAMSLWTGEDLPPHKIPLLGRFYGDTTGQSSEATRFYNNLRDINLHRAEIEGRRKDGGDVQGYLRDNPEARIGMAGPIQVEGQVRKLREAKRTAVERGDAARVRAIDGQITTAMRRFNERVSAAAQ